jgi:hypothetical protein
MNVGLPALRPADQTIPPLLPFASRRGDRITEFAAVQNVCFWHKADMAIALNNVRFWG